MWYDYKNKVWANIRIHANGVETNWVWIPRYAYKIENSAVDIKFVNLDNQYYNTDTNEWTTLEEGYLVAKINQDHNTSYYFLENLKDECDEIVEKTYYRTKEEFN